MEKLKFRPDLKDFFVVTVVSNPIRYKRRFELYYRFARMCECAGVNLITVEQAFGDRDFLLTDKNNPRHVQVRSVEELWHKENMINIGIKHGRREIPGVKYVAWVDADCAPVREPRNWFEETWHELQHYQFVQMWETMIDLDSYYSSMGEPMPSFMANYIKYGSPNPGEFKSIEATYPYGHKIFGRPGLAWAANLDALDQVGGLIDWAILGAGDWYMAHGLIGSMKVPTGELNASSDYTKKFLTWQDRAEKWIKRDVGYVRGLVYHYWHGNKSNRGYGTRGKILTDNQYNPNTDIKYDSQGMLQLETYDERQMKLRDQIRLYFRARNEDALSGK